MKPTLPEVLPLVRAVYRRHGAGCSAVDALRNVLGRTIETRIDPKTGKPYHYLNEERAKALALAGEVMR